MKRSEIKRGKPLARGQGLSRGSKPLKRTELKRGDAKLATGNGPARRSAARTRQMKEDRVPLIRALVEAGVGCEICPVLEEEGITTHCAGQIQGLHERRKSSSGGSRVNRTNLVPCCNWSNGTFIEDHPAMVRELFGSWLVVREGDEEWELLSKRNDRFD